MWMSKFADKKSYDNEGQMYFSIFILFYFHSEYIIPFDQTEYFICDISSYNTKKIHKLLIDRLLQQQVEKL